MNESIERLTPFLGEWSVETSLAPPGAVRARTTFEWALDGRFLLQRSEIDLAEAPDALCVIARDEQTGAFRQHYFDSRGVVRLYAMTFEDGVWTLLRESPDFTPLNFAQRLVGEFDESGTSIGARWETGSADGGWEKDFDITYEKVAAGIG